MLRAHRNAEAVIYSFLAVGLVFTLAGDGAWLAKTLFGVFAAARLAHSIAYLGGWQPWRTGFFVVSLLALAALMIATAALLV